MTKTLFRLFRGSSCAPRWKEKMELTEKEACGQTKISQSQNWRTKSKCSEKRNQNQN